MIIFGVVGLILISYAVWLRDERRQDVFFVAGGVSLLIYSLYIRDVIFIILQIVFIASAGFELIKISHRK